MSGKKQNATKSYRFEGYGVVFVRNWYGEYGFANVKIKTDRQGFEAIRRDPLQDYLNYGVAEISYVEITFFVTEVYYHSDKVVTIERLEPVAKIKAGDEELFAKYYKANSDIIETSELITVTYEA